MEAAPNGVVDDQSLKNLSFEDLSTNLQHTQLRDLYENDHNRSSNVETASSLTRKLQRTVAERCADLSRARDALHLAQHQVSSLQREIHSIETSIQQQQIDQLDRIKLAKSRLLQICDADDTVTTGTIVSTNATRGRPRVNRSISLTNDSCGDFCLQNGVSSSPYRTPIIQEKHPLTVGPIVMGRPIAAPIGPVRSRHGHLDIERSENNISNQDNSERDGDVKILDINPDGKYIKLRNTSSNQNYNLGHCRLQQEIAGHPVAIFRFPRETTLLPVDNVTVWAEGCLPTIGTSEPTDLIFRGLQKWGAGPHFTTLLFESRDKMVSQWNAVHRPPVAIPFQSTIQLQPPRANMLRSSSSTLGTSLSRSLRAEEKGKVFHQQGDTCNVHTGAISQLQRPYSAVSLQSRLRKVQTN